MGGNDLRKMPRAQLSFLIGAGTGGAAGSHREHESRSKGEGPTGAEAAGLEQPAENLPQGLTSVLAPGNVNRPRHANTRCHLLTSPTPPLWDPTSSCGRWTKGQVIDSDSTSHRTAFLSCFCVLICCFWRQKLEICGMLWQTSSQQLPGRNSSSSRDVAYKLSSVVSCSTPLHLLKACCPSAMECHGNMFVPRDSSAWDHTWTVVAQSVVGCS